MNFDIYISSIWFYIGIIMFLIALRKDTLFNRRFSVALFAIFCFIVCFKSRAINQDIANYILHFDGVYDSSGVDSFFVGIFEPGYNIVVWLISIFYLFLEYPFEDKRLFIFLVTLIPSAIFVWQFLKYRYSASTIFFIYATIILVSSTTILRHYYAMAFTFVILNRIILDSKRGGLMLFPPILFHYTTIPVIFSLFINDISRGLYKLQYLALIAVVSIITISFLGLDFFYYLINKGYTRMMDGMNQQGGLRNILNLFIVLLILLKIDNFSLVKERLNLLLWVSVSVSIALIPFYGLNRVTSFFTLVILVYFFKNQKDKIVNWILSFLALCSLVFFYLNHTVLSETVVF